MITRAKRQDDRETRGTPLRRLVERVDQAVRRMGAQSVMTSQAIAARFDLHTTDLECLDLIFMRGRVTAGELARATGLTSGAVTALIDRLERAGYVARVADRKDRRRVLVQVRREAVAPIQSVYEPMQRQMHGLWSTFGAQQLRIVADFLERSTDLAVACTEKASTGSRFHRVRAHTLRRRANARFEASSQGSSQRRQD